jgi:uncharacterized coiled-coil DUF342 family protein
VQNAERGVELNAEVMEQLAELHKGVARVREVMNEIAEASEQQQRGVDEINVAVEQMNELTQNIAASAEESAGSAEELRAQTRRVDGLVREFRLDGSHAGAGRAAEGRDEGVGADAAAWSERSGRAYRERARAGA